MPILKDEGKGIIEGPGSGRLAAKQNKRQPSPVEETGLK
jgi:hypothetical protein